MAEVLVVVAVVVTVPADTAVAAVEEDTETPAEGTLGGKHLITALRMFGPFFSS